MSLSNPSPSVSIILPVYNAGRHLRIALQSILDQTYTDLEIIAINDGSTDDSWKTLKEFQDPRIRLFSQENQGLVGTLNRGIDEARGEFIARMDQDDFSEPTRIEKQVAFLTEHPDVGLLGTTAYITDEGGRVTIVNPSLLHDIEIKLQLLYQNAFSHGSITLRRSVLNVLTPPYYHKEAGNTEDYDFWARLAPHTTFANLAEPLYGWRDNPTGMTNSGAVRQRQFASRVIERSLAAPYFRKLLTSLAPNPDGYSNETMSIHGTPAACKRRDSYLYCMYRSAQALWKLGFRRKALSLLFRSAALDPGYYARATVGLAR